MRNLIFILIVFVELLGASRVHATSFTDSVLVGGTGPADSKAQLDVKSTTKGALMPRMTTTQQNAITSPTEGLLIYDNVLHQLSNYNGTAWTAVGGTPNAATTSTLGTLKALAPVSHQFLTGLTTGTGVLTQAQPAFSDISGSVAASQLPNPSASTLGGVESLSVVSHNFLTGISTLGVPTQAQPAFTDISGNIAVTQMNSGTSASSTTFWRGDGTWATAGGTITGPGSSTNTAFARWNGTAGTAIQDSVFLGASTGILTTTGDTSGMTMNSVTDTTASASVGVDHNSTSLLVKTLESSTNAGYSLGLSTASIAGANANPTGGISLTTGNKTAGTGNSGGVTVTTGTSSGGTRGRIAMLDGSENNAGSVWTITGNSGSGRWQKPTNDVNFIAGNPDAELFTAGWATYADAAGVMPVTGSGGVPTVTWTRTTSSPLSGAGSFLFTKDAANRQGNGASFDFSIRNADKAKVMQIEFDYVVASGTFVAGSSGVDSDIEVYIYDITNAVVIQPTTYKLFSSTTSPPSHFVANFQTASNSTSYRLIFHTATTSASAYTVQFDSVTVSPSRYTYATAATDPVSVTMTTGGWVDANHVTTALESFVGKFAYYDVLISISGLPTSASLTVNLPSGRTIDTTALTKSTSLYGDIDTFSATIVSAGGVYSGDIVYNSTTSVAVYVKSISTFTGTVYTRSSAPVTQTVPATFASGDYIRLSFRVPIVGKNSTVQMSDSAPQAAVAMRAHASTGASMGTLSTSFSVTKFDTVDNDTNGAYNTSTGVYTVPAPGYYDIAAQVFTTGTAALNTNLALDLFNVTTSTEITQADIVSGGAQTTIVVPLNVKSVFLTAGTQIEIRAVFTGTYTSGAYANGTTLNFLSISRQGSPTSIGATETVAARYFASASTPGTSSVPNAMTFTTKDYDTHSFCTGGATCTLPVQGKFRVNVCFWQTAATTAASQAALAYIVKNGTTDTFTETYFTSSTSKPISTCVTDVINGVSGDAITFKAANDGTTPSISSNNAATYFTIERIGL